MEPCCQDPTKRADGPGPRGLSDQVNGDALPEGVTVTHCTVCSRRHFEMEADPVHLGVEVASL